MTNEELKKGMFYVTATCQKQNDGKRYKFMLEPHIAKTKYFLNGKYNEEKLKNDFTEEYVITPIDIQIHQQGF